MIAARKKNGRPMTMTRWIELFKRALPGGIAVIGVVAGLLIPSVASADENGPVVTITSGPAALVSTGSATVEFTVDDPEATTECRLDSTDDSDWAACASPFNAEDLEDGAHSLEIRATDATDTVGAVAGHEWTVDTTPPSLSLDSGPDPESNSIRAGFTFSSDDPDATTECRIDPTEDSEWEPCASPVNLDDLADGEHRFEVRATDQVGNSSLPLVHEWTVTTVKPTAEITSGPADPTDQETASLEFDSDNPAASFECRLDPTDDTEWTVCSSPAEFQGVSEGDHRFEVRATDPDQGTGPVASYEWSVDLTVPTVELTGAPAAISGTADPVFGFEASEPGTIAECRLDPVDDDASWTACASPTAYEGLAEGSHHFEVRVTDAVGHVSEPVSYDWIVETTPPDVTIQSGPENPTTEISAEFSFASGNSNASFECRLDGDAWSGCVSGIAFDQLADGEHDFEVRAVGQGAGPGPVDSRTWVVDTVVPTVVITNGPEHVTNETTADFAFEASKPGFTYRCQIDSEPAGACSSPVGYTDLDAANHQLVVELVNADDQVVDSATWSWKVLADRPVATITSSPSAVTSADAAAFEFQADVPEATFECRLDGGAWSHCNSPEGLAGLADGSHTFAVRAGLPGSTPGAAAERDWTVDTTAPDLRITGGPDLTSTSDAASFGIETDDPAATIECSLDDGAWAACGSQVELTGLADGSHALRVRAIDAVGNTGFARHDWNIDRTAPSITLNSVPAAVTTAQSARFAFASDDPDATFECQLDDGAWKACTSAREETGLAVGPHRFALRASDRAGNLSDSLLYEWQITVAPPQGLAPSLKIFAKARLNPDGATRIGTVICPEGRCKVTGSKRVKIRVRGRKLIGGVHAPRNSFREPRTAVTLITTTKIRNLIRKAGRATVKVNLTVVSDNGKQQKVARTITLSGR